MRIGECLALKMDDIDTKCTPVKVSIMRKNTKTKHRRFTFISEEADSSIKEWLSYRDEWLKTTQARSTNYQIRDDEKLFPISEGSFKDIWTRALTKCGLAKRDKATNRLTLHPHSLRKYFRTRGGWTNPDIPEALMGHQAGITAIYARFDQADDILSKDYLQAETHLSITAGAQTISDLHKRITKQSDDITQLVTNLSLRNAKLENELNQIKEDMTKFVDLVQNDSAEIIKDLSERLSALEERDRRLSEIEFENDILTQA